MVVERDNDSISSRQKLALSPKVVIAGPSSTSLAISVSKAMGLSMISPELRVFSDGESKIRIKEKLENKTCIIVQSTYSPQVDRHILQTLMMLKKCVDDAAKDIIVVVPYLAYARQDSAFLQGEVVTIDLLANLYESFGARNMVTVDIHSARALSYFEKRMNTTNLSAIPLLADYAKSKLRMNTDNSITVSPDEGGFKRAISFANELDNNITCMKKTRDRSTGEIKVDYLSSQDIGRIQGVDVALIDDIVSTGSTIIKTAEILRSCGCRRINVMCSHALMTPESTQQIKAAGVDRIVTTNSVPRMEAMDAFVETIDLGPIIANAILRITS